MREARRLRGHGVFGGGIPGLHHALFLTAEVNSSHGPVPDHVAEAVEPATLSEHC